jgi:hypothetical protein
MSSKKVAEWSSILILGHPADKKKVPARLVTAVTVLFLIIAGSPLSDVYANTASADTNPYAATVTLGSLAQTYTGSALTPTATTSPVGLTIDWTGAPQTGAGSYAVSATVNDLNYVGSATGTFVINEASSSVIVTCPMTAQTYTGSAIAPCTASYSTGDGLVGSLTPGYSGNTNVGTATASATYAGDANHEGNSNSATFVINKATATVTSGSMTQTYTGSPLTPSATTVPAGLTIDWTNAPQTNAGSYAVTATVNDANYEGSASGTFTISKAGQTITFGALADKTKFDAAFPVSATASSGLTVSFTASGKCTVSGSTVTLDPGLGRCTITASQAGNVNYNAAADVLRTFNINNP